MLSSRYFTDVAVRLDAEAARQTEPSWGNPRER